MSVSGMVALAAGTLPDRFLYTSTRLFWGYAGTRLESATISVSLAYATPLAAPSTDAEAPGCCRVKVCWPMMARAA